MARPSSLVVNTSTSHLVVTGSIPIWVTSQQRERWGAGFNSRSPRGLVKFGHVLGYSPRAIMGKGYSTGIRTRDLWFRGHRS